MGPADEAMGLYERTCLRGLVHKLWTALRGQSSQLLDLTTVAASCTISTRHYVAEQTVPIRQIRGSEGRCADFDELFHPRQGRTEGRWRSIAKAYMQGASLPPVDLICVGAVYFVRDGHHRISVAAALGQQEIDAVVTVWQVQGPNASAPGAADKSADRPGNRESWGVSLWACLGRYWRGCVPGVE